MENMFRVLHQLREPSPALISTLNSISDTDTSQSLSTLFLPTSSPPDPFILHNTNQVFLSDFTFSNIHQQCKNHVHRLNGIAKRLQIEVTILQKELIKMKAVHSKRKERAFGKQVILKEMTVVSTEEV
jgi:hypothetical protein